MAVKKAKIVVNKNYVEYEIEGEEPRMKFFDTAGGRQAKQMWDELNKPLRRKGGERI